MQGPCLWATRSSRGRSLQIPYFRFVNSSNSPGNIEALDINPEFLASFHGQPATRHRREPGGAVPHDQHLRELLRPGLRGDQRVHGQLCCQGPERTGTANPRSGRGSRRAVRLFGKLPFCLFFFFFWTNDGSRERFGLKG